MTWIETKDAGVVNFDLVIRLTIEQIDPTVVEFIVVAYFFSQETVILDRFPSKKEAGDYLKSLVSSVNFSPIRGYGPPWKESSPGFLEENFEENS